VARLIMDNGIRYHWLITLLLVLYSGTVYVLLRGCPRPNPSTNFYSRASVSVCMQPLVLSSAPPTLSISAMIDRPHSSPSPLPCFTRSPRHRRRCSAFSTNRRTPRGRLTHNYPRPSLARLSTVAGARPRPGASGSMASARVAAGLRIDLSIRVRVANCISVSALVSFKFELSGDVAFAVLGPYYHHCLCPCRWHCHRH
jgi:hypothetical protein